MNMKDDETAQEEEEEEEMEVEIGQATSEDDEDGNDEEKKVWFEKLKPLVDHFCTVSEELIFILGTNVSIDEMII